MADLKNLEKRKLEKLLGMGTGYVLDFSNRTFDEFFLDTLGISIYEDKYNQGSGSKANRLRAFWEQEGNHTVAKLLSELLSCIPLDANDPEKTRLYDECAEVVSKLANSASVQVISLTPNSPEKEFALLAREVRESIERNEPEVGLDRLHTFSIKYIRVLCQKYGIDTDREKPLHSLAGEYVKALQERSLIESEMTARILKSSISTLEAFNRVRNEQSLAHDNKLLGYDESLLIYNHVSSSIRFIESLENGPKKVGPNKQ